MSTEHILLCVFILNRFFENPYYKYIVIPELFQFYNRKYITFMCNSWQMMSTAKLIHRHLNIMLKTMGYDEKYFLNKEEFNIVFTKIKLHTITIYPEFQA